MLLYLNDTQIIDCMSTEGKSQAVLGTNHSGEGISLWANEHGDEPHTFCYTGCPPRVAASGYSQLF